MNKQRMRTLLEDMIATLDLDEPDDRETRRAPTAEDILQELRASRKALAEAFRPGPAAADPPERRTLDAATKLSLQKAMSQHEYRSKKWEGMDSTERIAAQLEATAAPDSEKDIAASSPQEIEAAIGAAMRALHPPQSHAMRADVREQPPILRRRVGECFGSPSDPIIGWTRGD